LNALGRALRSASAAGGEDTRRRREASVVKKATLFERLFHPFRSGSGVRVEDGAGQRLPSAAAPVERVEGKKLTPREDAVSALSEGFAELGGILRGVQVRLEGEGAHVAAIEQHLQALPANAAAQLGLLEKIAGSLGDLPRVVAQIEGSLQGMQQALERATAADQRTSKTIEEFRAAMDRVQDTMHEFVDSSRVQAQSSTRQADASQQLVTTLKEERRNESAQMQKAFSSLAEGVDGIGKAQADANRALQQATQQSIEQLRAAQEDQATRLSRLVEQNGKWSRAVLVTLAGAAVVLACILGVLLAR
jgi:chromosome segregation ATPase